MRILWLTWKDLRHPNSGGAEFINEEMAKRLVRDGNEVTFFVAQYPGCKVEEMVDGYKVIRGGNKFTVYWHAFRYYKKNQNNLKLDLVIDEVNTVPFFAKFYVNERSILFFHQLCREIWFYEIFFPLSLIGFLVEPIYLWLLSREKVITVSQSTKKDLMRFGFEEKNINIIPNAVNIKPIDDLSSVVKYSNKTVLSLGAMRSMKRTLDQVKAFEMAKKFLPELKFKVVGSYFGAYGKKVENYILKSPYKEDIELSGQVSFEDKERILSHCHLLLVTSVKEGWGLVVTEANLRGTVAAVYDVDGLRDSVISGKTGVVAGGNNPEALSKEIIRVLSNDSYYHQLQSEALKFARDRTLDKAYQIFLSSLVGEEHGAY